MSIVLPLNEGNSVDSEDAAKPLQPGSASPVITYISQHSAHKRKVLKEALVQELKALVGRKSVEREAGREKKKVEFELVKDREGSGRGVGWAHLAEATSSQQPEWELKVLEAEHMTKDEKVRAAFGRPYALFPVFKVLILITIRS